MPQFELFQVDAFAGQVFEGNPAAVVPLREWLPDETLLNIARENNLSETAFFLPEGDHFRLRWFTPAKEVRLCGHATLASAHVLFSELRDPSEILEFHTLGGILTVRRQNTGYLMSFPADYPRPTPPLPDLEPALGCSILDVQSGADDILVRIASKTLLDQLRPDFRRLAEVDTRGVIVTTEGTDTDIASRCFFPNYGIDEDPVTGSAHTLLTPYWSAILGKEELTAVQGGARKGYLQARLEGDRVILKGAAHTYLKGTIRWT